MKIHPSFTNAFFRADSFSNLASSQAQHIQQRKPVLFSDEKYRGTTTMQRFEQFMASPDFHECQREYAALADGIVAFIRENADKCVPALSSPTVESIQADFDTLKKHLSDVVDDFFSAHKPIVYGHGKEMFHELANLLGDEKIPLQKRMNAVKAMAPQMRVCSGGMLTVLQEGIASLKCSTAGIKGAAYRVKIQMIDALIAQHVKDTHCYDPGNEVHFVNAYFNYLAKDMGIPERMDKFTAIAEPEILDDQYEGCREKVLKKLNPAALSTAMADDYLDKIKGAQQIDVNGTFEGKQLKDVFDNTENIKKAALDSEFGEVPADRYLLEVPDTDTYSYRFARQSTLLARHFMEALRNEKLVDYDDTISLTAGDGQHGAIKMLGDLFWRDNQGSCEELKAQELSAVSPHAILQALKNDKVDPGAHGAILQGIAQHVLDARESENIENVPETWLQEFADLLKQKQISRSEIVPVVMLAALFNHANVLRALIKAKADIKATDTEGVPALMHAALKGHADALKALIETKGGINVKSRQGVIATICAAQKGHVDALKALIDAGANINGANARGVTVAMYAAYHGHADALKVLIDAGANLKAKDRYGKTAAMHAMEHADVLKIIEDANNNPVRKANPLHRLLRNVCS